MIEIKHCTILTYLLEIFMLVFVCSLDFVRRILQLASVFLIRQLSARNDENHYRSLTYLKKQWKDLVVK
jgi:hypothetical protein